jgi:iron complex transport system permease protein
MAKTDGRRSAFVLSATLLAAAMLAGVLTGPAAIGVGDLTRALVQPLLSSEHLPGWQAVVIWQVRLPRVLIAAMVGAALAVSGAVLQGLFRNPLASPSVLGVASGASLGAVLAIFFGLAATKVWALPLFAFCGALLTLFAVYGIATRGGHTPVATLLLAGIAAGAFNVAMSSFVLALALENWDVGKSIVYWTMGGLEGRTWDHVLLLAPFLVGGLVLTMVYPRDLDALLLGEAQAASVGVDVARTRLVLLLVTALLTAAAVAVAGGIGFVGLVVPHMVRLLAGPHHRRLLPLSALMGALVLVTADLALRTWFAANEIPLGVVTAALGAPFFLFLLLRQRGLMSL